MIKITSLAKTKIEEVAEAQGRKGDGLRVLVRNGGTPAVEFGLNFVGEDQVQDDDQIVEVDGLKIHVDPESSQFLDDATVDFVETPQGAGFKVDAPKAIPPRPSGPLADKVQKVIDERVNPAIGGHGGRVTLEALEENVAYLRFGGGCQGCGMINTTLKQGVEVMIKDEVPEIVAVRDVTDHAAGENPYYRK
jgi:Fe/S biogenesis protein NfuA